MKYIGVDLGKRVDPAAIAIVEQAEAMHIWMPPADTRLGVRWLERVALGTPYTLVARRIEEIVRRLRGQCAVAVDATGLGAPVVDVLRDARLDCELSAVVMTGGERQNRSGNIWHVPKRDLVSGLQMLLEKGELRIAKGLRETGALVRELVGMRATPSTRGSKLAGVGEHDDLVMAVALACWAAGRGQIEGGGRRLPGL